MARWRPWLVYGIGTVVLLGLFLIGAYVTGWPPHLDICFMDGTCYCEGFGEHNNLETKLRPLALAGTAFPGVQQPVNTWSNLYALITGGWVALQMFIDRGKPNPANVIMSRWWMGDVWVFCVLFLGLGSMWFHGSMSASISWFDGFSMYVFTGFLVFYTLDRYFVSKSVSDRTRAVVFWIGYPSTVVTLTILGILQVASTTLIGVLLAVYAVLELCFAGFVFWRRPMAFRSPIPWRSPIYFRNPDQKWKWIPFILWACGLLAFIAAAIFRGLSTKVGDPMCWPDSGFQPHGLLWHTLAGVMAILLYYYWRHDDGSAGNLPHHYQ